MAVQEIRRHARLYPLKKAKGLRRFGTFDLETRNKRLYISGFYYGGKYRMLKGEDELIKFLTKQWRGKEPTMFYVHNLSFDGLYLADLCYKRGVKFDYIEHAGRMFEFRINIRRPGSDKNRWLRFRDSYSIFPKSQKTLAEMFQVETKKYELDFEGLEKLPDWQVLPEYRMRNETDCVGLYQIMEKASAFVLDEFGIDMAGCMTIAQFAMKAFRRSLREPILNPCVIKVNGRNETLDVVDVFTKAYAGGRVEVFRMGKSADMKKYDINSMYPSVMLNPVPVGGMKVLDNPSIEQLREIIEKYEGFVDATMSNVPVEFPVLWAKTDGKLMFMNFSESRGTFAFPEIRRAAQYGLAFTKIHKIVYFTRSEPIFKDHIESLYRKRMESGGGAWSFIYKLLMNSLYGKFGQRPERKKVRLVTPAEAKGMVDTQDVEQMGDVFFVREEERRVASFYMPHIAAYVASYARVKIHEYILKAEKPVYTDTDSVVCSYLYEDSRKLGLMKLEKSYSCFDAINAKVYQADGERKAKGIPRGKMPEDLNSLFDSPVEWETFASLRKSLSSVNNVTVSDGLVKYLRMSRMFRMRYSKREIMPDGVTTAPFSYTEGRVLPASVGHREAWALHKYR